MTFNNAIMNSISVFHFQICIPYFRNQIHYMFSNYKFTAAERFIQYVQIDTQSDPQSNQNPSTVKQFNLSELLVKELLEMGISDAHVDEWGYVYATLPSNTEKEVSVICFCSHVDTAPDCSGENVKPIVHTNYQGDDIVLPDDISLVISAKDYPYLLEHKGHTVITASGLTLLGADDKSGVAEIMDFANYIVTHPNIKHGTIKLLFTPDEEIGQGTAKIDLNKLGATVAYTLDGGEAGTLEDETFSADGVTITVYGVIAHPGYAKGKLVNALKIVGEILAELPKDNMSPETTEKREGFFHPTHIEGIAEKASVGFIIRDFENNLLDDHTSQLRAIAEKVLARHPLASMDFVVREQYRNMRFILDQHPHITLYAAEAYQRSG